MKDSTLYAYEIIVTLAATVTGLASVVALLTEASWLAIAAACFMGVWAFILVSSIPMVYLHDRGDNDEFVHHH